MSPGKISNGTVYVVDDDVSVQHGISALLQAADYDVVPFHSAREFVKQVAGLDTVKSVMLLDVCMPGMQGTELQEKLLKENIAMKIIVMTAHGDVPMAVKAMKNGAVDFLEKPFTAEEIIDALERAFSMIEVSTANATLSLTALKERFSSLTPRELEVLREITNGHTSKEIARLLGLSPRTVDVHRQNLMHKMHARTVADLVRMAVTAGLSA